jgi:hypothetical protein
MADLARRMQRRLKLNREDAALPDTEVGTQTTRKTAALH